MRGEKLLYTERSAFNQLLSGLKKAFLFLVLPPLTIAVIIPILLSIFLGKDIPMFDDSDLILGEVNISDRENAYFDIASIKEVYEPKNKDNDLYREMFEGGDWNAELASTTIFANYDNYRKFDNAMKKDKFVIPHLAKPNSEMFKVEPLNYWRTISRVVSVKALSLAREGEPTLAVEETMKIIKFGHLVESSQSSLIANLVGIAVKKQGLKTLDQIISETDIGYDALKNYLSALDNYDTIPNTTFFQYEYMWKKQSAEEFMENGYSLVSVGHQDYQEKFIANATKFYLNNKFYHKPYVTLEYEAERFRDIISYFNAPCQAPELKSTHSYPLDSLWELPKLYITENAIGKWIIQRNNVALSNVKRKRCENQTALDTLKIKIATKLILLDNADTEEDSSDLD